MNLPKKKGLKLKKSKERKMRRKSVSRMNKSKKIKKN